MEIVEERQNVAKLSEINAADRSVIKKVLESPLLDEGDSEAIHNMDKALISDSVTISERMKENEEDCNDTLGEMDSMIESLKGNLEKLEKIRATSDLVNNTSSSETTQNRIEELRRIRDRLKGESDTDNPVHIEKKASLIQTDSIIEFKDSLKAKGIESVKHDYALGVLASNVSFSNAYKKILYERYVSGEKLSREVFDVAVGKKKLSIVDGDWKGGAHFNPYDKTGKKKGVYYNAKADELDDKNRGKGTSFFHEIGHMLDYCFGGNKCISSSEAFLSALNDDLSKIRVKLDTDALWKQKFLQMLFTDNSAHSISDILEGLTNGSICGKFGHMGGDINYWNRDRYRVCNESFAHFFEASMGSGIKLRRIKICFPGAYKEYERILNDIVQNNNSDAIRIRERSLDDER